MATKKQNRGPGLLLRNAGIFNPVLVQAVGLCPVVAMATTIKGSALLALVAAVTITLCELIASMFLKVIPRWVRTGIYIILGGAIITPFMILIEELNPTLFGTLGIYLPVMAVNSLLVLRCERFAVKLSPVSALKDGLSASAGYAAVLLLVGTVREIFGSGSLAGFKFWEGRAFSGLMLPFGGLLMIGFSAALLRMIISVYWPKYLDKKQPKPGAKKIKAAKPAVKQPVPELPDLTPEDTPFSLTEIANEVTMDYSAFGFEPFEKGKTVAPTIGRYGETIIEEPEIVSDILARKLFVHEPVTPTIEEPAEQLTEAESLAEDIPEITQPEESEESKAAYVPESDFADESAHEAAEDTDTSDINGNDENDENDVEDTAESSEDDKYTDEDYTDSSDITYDSPSEETPVENSAASASNSFDDVDDDELEMLLNRPVDDIFKKQEEDKK